MRMLDENGISEELRNIIENSDDMIFVKNKDYVYIAASRRYALDCVHCTGVEDVLGKTDFELFKDQSIAQKYRQDDESLFASDRPMSVFVEDFPDKNGKKHTCRTTKILLHDPKGHAQAIFGQYHDLDPIIEEEVQMHRSMDRKITEALSSVFYASYFIDLTDGSFTILKGTEYARVLLEQAKNIHEATALFIESLVDKEDRAKMQEFCNIDTLGKRLEHRTHIDCEYRGTLVNGWCQTSFLPVAYDDDNRLTHVLFVLSSIDQNRAKGLQEGLSSKKDLDILFEVVPSGIVVYEWDGKQLRFVSTNQRYREWFGYAEVKKGDVPAYAPIHPDDQEAYHKAIEHALNITHRLVHVLRVFDSKKNRYRWLQINAVAKPQKDGKSLVYAIFTDITNQAEAGQKIAKQQASLVSALEAANQLCCEYDPLLHTIHCFTEHNFLSMPRDMSGYPECLRTLSLLYPDDLELFIKTVHITDDGKQEAHCDVRAWCDGSLRWYSCRFKPYFDPAKDRSVVFLTIIDATMRIESMRNYRMRLRSLEKSNEDALCMCDVNITRNWYGNIQGGAFSKKCSAKAGSLSELILELSAGVLDEEERKYYLDQFQCANILKRFEQGESSIRFEHLFRIDEKNTMMVVTVFELMKEPMTGDVVGVAYAKDQNEEKISSILLKAALEKDYLMVALVIADTQEYYLYEVDRHQSCLHKQKYWEAVTDRLAEAVDQEDLAEVRAHLDGNRILQQLKVRTHYAYAFYVHYHGQRCRVEADFRYADAKRHLLIATLRNITDEELYLKYKHESEHDPLTGLYNRSKVFEQAQILMKEHPKEQFVMLHIDVRHFHLYNTFFGEAAGDRLLKKIANVLNLMAMEYDYLSYGRMEADVFCVFFPVNRGLFEGHVRRCFQDLERFSPDFPLEMAVGAYWVKDDSMSMEAMFARATIAAKSHVLNLFDLISRYDEAMEKNLVDTQEITSEMVNAIEQEQFEVYLQPKVALRSRQMVGAEALVRWRHPQKGLIPPGRFIPVFEQNGFIARLDCYMWEHVCALLRDEKKRGLSALPISVNLSRVSMYSHATVPFLKSLIQKYQLDPSDLQLELTESAYMDDPLDLKRMLKELQEYGFKILMDDFGSGYSSLNTLRDLPVDILKLDMKFLSMSKEDARGNAVLSSVVRMSKLLDLPIVAEGVETTQQADYLCSIGCEYAQGYLFSRPIPVSEYEKALMNVHVYKEESIAPSFKDDGALDSLCAGALLEYRAHRFAILRANHGFMEEFDLIEDRRPASKVFKERMKPAEYDRFLNALDRCVKSKQEVTASIAWCGADGKERIYQIYVQDLGMQENQAVLRVLFLNMTSVLSL